MLPSSSLLEYSGDSYLHHLEHAYDCIGWIELCGDGNDSNKQRLTLPQLKCTQASQEVAKTQSHQKQQIVKGKLS
jgi:hypothetical protein